MVQVSQPWRSVVKTTALWTSKGTVCFSDTVVKFCIYVGRAGEWAADVGKGLHRLELLTLHCDVWILVWDSCGGLLHHFSLFGADGET